MSAFDDALRTLLKPLSAHPDAAARLRRCRNLEDLNRVITAGGWLSPPGSAPRIKLVRHGSGTWLVVAYDEGGWSTRLGMAAVERARRW
jgi:hypothetical protein